MATRAAALYDEDYYAWAKGQAEALRDLAEARWNGPLDLENLAEEVDDLARSEWRAVRSQTTRLIEHLLKLEHARDRRRDTAGSCPSTTRVASLAGNDTLFGGNGNDKVMSGGDGRDLLFGGNDEDALVGGNDNDQLLGEAGVDFLRGDSGSDRLFGGAEFDELLGSSGNDTVRGGDGNDVVRGNDEISGPEDDDDTLFGDGGDDRLFGDDILGAGDDLIYGGDGDDDIFGVFGNDRAFGGNGADAISALGEGRLLGGAGNDRLSSSGGNDTLAGGTGDDTLDASLGRDQLAGDAGADRFDFDDSVGGGTAVYDTGVGKGNRDRIIDFDDGDRINLAGIDADLATILVNEAFVFVGDDPVGTGELGFLESGGSTVVRGNTDADAAADFEIQLDGVNLGLTASDFLRSVRPGRHATGQGRSAKHPRLDVVDRPSLETTRREKVMRPINGHWWGLWLLLAGLPAVAAPDAETLTTAGGSRSPRTSMAASTISPWSMKTTRSATGACEAHLVGHARSWSCPRARARS